MKQGFTAALVVFFCSVSLFPQDKQYKWIRFGGNWVITNSRAVETQAYATSWKYYYILDYNSIMSLNDLNDYTSIEFSSELFGREKSPVEFTFSFAVRSESQSWYYHMYGFRFSGGFWGIKRADLIHSDRIDRSKPYNTKGNKYISILATSECNIKYSKTYNYRISFESNNIVLYINNELILSAPFSINNISGKIAFSSGNARLAIDSVRVIKNNEVIFMDDFDTKSIFVKKLNASTDH